MVYKRIIALPIILVSQFSGGIAPVFAQSTPASTANPAAWPVVNSPVRRDPAIEQRIAALLNAMSLEQKVGQIIQGDVGSTTPDDVARYHLGSVLNGGNSAPNGKAYAPAPEWVAAADAYYLASMQQNDALPRIPVIWGSDAVHGHNNVIGATLFPHNIGLGAMRNPQLMRRIGQVTAIEMRVTGLDWTFAPTLAVVRDDRWGRTYESYSENPTVVASYARPLIEGLQGRVGSRSWLRGQQIIATAKHFVGDGGTNNGKDQGETTIPEAQLRDQQAAGYQPAIEAGIQSVMASYNSWNGEKLHGNRSLLTDVLRGPMHFDGFVVGDWNGHGQVAGCTPTNCPRSLMAGLDMYMAPDSWKQLYDTTLQQVRDGTIPMSRLDEAVARILRVKMRAGLFDIGKPSSRPFAGRFELLGSVAHRAIARQAVRESLVLLKNEGRTLPLKAGSHILVAGDGADNYMKQAGGWTLTWQGTELKREDFPGATTIWAGIQRIGAQRTATTELSSDGSYKSKPDVAIVVFGENPYAEFQGDVPDLLFRDTANNLALLQKYNRDGIKTVAVFLSGRPMWVNPYLNASDAFIAAWLPGSEGDGIAEVLFGKYDFKGKLSFSWPKRANQGPLNVGDAGGYDPLFGFGYGLTYASTQSVGQLPELSGLVDAANADSSGFYARGRAVGSLSLSMSEAYGPSTLIPPGLVQVTTWSWLTAKPADHLAQEDAIALSWSGAGSASAELRSSVPLNLSRETNGDLGLAITFKVSQVPAGKVILSMVCGTNCWGSLDISGQLTTATGQGWATKVIPLKCFERAGARMDSIEVPFRLETDKVLGLAISKVSLAPAVAGQTCS